MWWSRYYRGGMLCAWRVNKSMQTLADIKTPVPESYHRVCAVDQHPTLCFFLFGWFFFQSFSFYSAGYPQSFYSPFTA